MIRAMALSASLAKGRGTWKGREGGRNVQLASLDTGQSRLCPWEHPKASVIHRSQYSDTLSYRPVNASYNGSFISVEFLDHFQEEYLRELESTDDF